jgi:F-type H+-transporting ATPase subunit delta
MKLQEKLLARKYAQAYFHVFGDQITQAVIPAIEQFVAFYLQHKEKFFYLGLSSFAARMKADALMKNCDQFGLRQLLQPLVTVLAEQARLTLIEQVLEELIVLYKHAHNIIDVACMSAHPLDAQEQKVITEFLEKATGKTINASLIINPDLIAGVRLQSDTFLWERSLEQQLRAIRAE